VKIAAAALALAVLAAVPAEARIKKPAHKKKEDLSANPLAASTPNSRTRSSSTRPWRP